MKADGAIHLAFNHEQIRSGDYAAAIAADLAVVHALGDALAGTGKPQVGTSGTLALAYLDRPGTEEDAGAPGGRTDAGNAVIGFAGRGVRSSVVRVPPITHSTLDRHGFARTLIAIAKQTGVAGYPGDGTNRWPAGHTLDVGHLFCLALEGAPAGTRPAMKGSRYARSPRASATTWAYRPQASRLTGRKHTSGSWRR